MFSSTKGQMQCGRYFKVILQFDIELMSDTTQCLMPDRCEAGKISAAPNATECTECEAGKYAGGPGWAECHTCGPGKYAPAGSRVCTSCTEGKNAPSGSKAATECKDITCLYQGQADGADVPKSCCENKEDTGFGPYDH
jgi:hypothetical protein